MSGRPADAPPARGEAAAEGAPHGVAHALRAAFYHAVAVPLLFVACKVWFGHRVEGVPRSSLPQGGYVVVANHVHYLDCVLIALAVWPRRVVFLVDRCNWDHPVIGVFMRLFECIPTGETRAQTRAMLKAVGDVPRRGGVLAVFPEGERTNYHRGLGEFRPGAFSVASHAGAPVVPVVLVQNPRARGLCRLFGHPGFTVVRGMAIGVEDAAGMEGRSGAERSTGAEGLVGAEGSTGRGDAGRGEAGTEGSAGQGRVDQGRAGRVGHTGAPARRATAELERRVRAAMEDMLAGRWG